MTRTHDQQHSTNSDKPKDGRGPRQDSRQEMERQAAEEAARRFEQAVQTGMAGMDAWWKTVAAQTPEAVASAIAGKWKSLEPALRDEATSAKQMATLLLETSILLRLRLSVELYEQDADKACFLLVKACNAIACNPIPRNHRGPAGKHLKAFKNHMLRGRSPALTKFEFAERPSQDIAILLRCVEAAAFPDDEDQDAARAQQSKGANKLSSQEHEPPLLQWLLKSGLFGQLSAEHKKRAVAKIALWPYDFKETFKACFGTQQSLNRLSPDVLQALGFEDRPKGNNTGNSPPCAVQVPSAVPKMPALHPAVAPTEPMLARSPKQSPSEPLATLPPDVPPAPLGKQQMPSDTLAANLLLRVDELRQSLQAITDAREIELRELADQLKTAQQDVTDLRSQSDLEKLNRIQVEKENGNLRKKLGEAETVVQEADARAEDLRQQVTRLTDEVAASLQLAQHANERLTAEENRHRQNLQGMRERIERDKQGEVQVFINGLSDKLQLEWREFHAGEGRQMDAESGTSLRKFVRRMFDMLEREGLKFRK